MAALAFLVLFLAMAGRSSGSYSWCVCKQAGDAVLQKTLDYACGAGADCNPIHQNGPCFNPNTVLAHCNYAVNSYFQRKGQAPGSCDFSGTASVSPTDPSTAGCAYPASASTSTSTPGTSTTPSTTNPTPTTVNPTTPGGSSTSPFVTNPSTGVLGGNSGLGPSGAGINTDESDGGITLHRNCMLPFFMVMMFSGFVHLWG